MIRANMAEPMWRQVPRALGWMLNYLFTGTLFRVYRASLSIRPRADDVPDRCWSGGSSLSGSGRMADRMAGDAVYRRAARVRRRRRRIVAALVCFRLLRPLADISSWCRSTAIGRICWNTRAASRPAGIAASRPARSALSRSREPTPPTRSSWSATAAAASPRRPWWRARLSLIPISAVTARASCC